MHSHSNLLSLPALPILTHVLAHTTNHVTDALTVMITNRVVIIIGALKPNFPQIMQFVPWPTTTKLIPRRCNRGHLNIYIIWDFMRRNFSREGVWLVEVCWMDVFLKEVGRGGGRRWAGPTHSVKC